MTRPKPTKLAAPFEHIEVTIFGIGPVGGEIERHELRIKNTKAWQGSTTEISYAESEAVAVLKAIRRHKAQIRRDAAKGKEAGA